MELIDFFERFFESLKCIVKRENNCLSILEVPASFEKFSGKKAPYYLCFNFSVEGFELINSNHYLIKSMKEFLEGRGETTLLKAEFQFDPKKEIPEIIPFRNCEIKSFSKSSRNDFIFRFSFVTIFQYLNEREQIMNNIYLRNNEVIDFDEGIDLIEGSKRELREINLNDEYEIAKSKLRELTEGKIKELGEKLKEQLKKEIERVESHYGKNISEIVQQKESLNKQLEGADSEKKKKVEKMLQKIEEESSLKKFIDEKNTLIEHETRKHGLSVKNKLINASVIYFPIFEINLVLSSGNIDKIVPVEYDPLKKELSPLFCSACKEKLSELILCASGHLTCRNCGDKCEVCEGVFCKSCADLKCGFCGRRICSSCAEICLSCKRVYCKKHFNPIPSSRVCSNCMKKCSGCGAIIDLHSAKEFSGRTFCLKCYQKQVGKNLMKDVFG